MLPAWVWSGSSAPEQPHRGDEENGSESNIERGFDELEGPEAAGWVVLDVVAQAVFDHILLGGSAAVEKAGAEWPSVRHR